MSRMGAILTRRTRADRDEGEVFLGRRVRGGEKAGVMQWVLTQLGRVEEEVIPGEMKQCGEKVGET